MTDTNTGGRTWRIGPGIIGSSNFNIYDHTATASRVHIDSSGRVGIGTTSPLYDLQVFHTGATIALGGAPTSNGSGRLKFINSNSQKNWQISTNDTASGALEFTQSTAAGGSTFTTPLIVCSSGGNVGIGTSSPGYKLDVSGNLNASGLLQGGNQVLHAGNWTSYTDGRHTRKDTTGQYLKPFHEYGSYLTTETPSNLASQMGGGGLRVDFMHPSYTGSGNWNHVITFSGYNYFNMYQLGANYDGGTGTDLWVRSEANHGGTSWTAWRKLLNSSNYTSYSPSLTGSGASGTWGINVTGTAYGLNVHTGRNNEANKVVRTDSSGYLQTGYINSTNGDENNASSPARVWGTNGSDSYLRTYQTGSLSVGNASTAGGLAVHSSTNNEANKIVRTQSNGYIMTGWINTISGDSGVANRLTRIYSSTDDYIRYSTLKEFKVHMGLSYKNDYSRRIDYTTNSDYWVGSMGHSGYGANETFHGGSGFFDIWSGTNYPSGTSHIHGFNALHYTVNSFGTTGGNAYGIQLAGQYNQGGQIFTRGCSGGTFSSWRKQLDDQNYTSVIDAPNRVGHSYYQVNTWLQFNGVYGLYAPNNNSAHFYPNDGTYGPWKISGTRNGWNGLEFSAPANNGHIVFMTNSNECGVYNTSYGWQWQWYNGNLRQWKNAYGGGNVYNVLDTGGGWVVSGNQNEFTASTYPLFVHGAGSVNSNSGMGLQVFSNTGSGAMMSFHRGGYFAVNMGLDSDNVIRIGGWSASSNRLQLDMSGNLTCPGSKSFEIIHPIDASKKLRYGAIEGPKLDVIHRGTARVEHGTAVVSIDEAAGLLPGTFVALTQNVQCYVVNNQSWVRVRGTVTNGTLTIVSDDPAADPFVVDWLVIGERHDNEICASLVTDADGHLINEYPTNAPPWSLHPTESLVPMNE